jgi:hypothetical protein
MTFPGVPHKIAIVSDHNIRPPMRGINSAQRQNQPNTKSTKATGQFHGEQSCASSFRANGAKLPVTELAFSTVDGGRYPARTDDLLLVRQTL